MARKRESIAFINQCQKALKQIEKMEQQKPKKLISKIDEMAKSVIAQWYATYDPRKYRRQRSLYQAYRIEQDGIDVEIKFDSAYISDFTHHQDNELIYENSFIQGYHGGSMGTDQNDETVDTPYWRKPFLHYTMWGEPAKKNFSPYRKILQESNKLMDNYDKEWAEDLENKVIVPLRRSLGGLQRK